MLLLKNFDRARAKTYFENKEGITLTIFKVNIKIDYLLKECILKDGVVFYAILCIYSENWSYATVIDVN